MAVTTRAAIYLRESEDREGDELGITRHGEDCDRIAAERGWTVVARYVDNGCTASDRTKARPRYDQMVADYAAGRFSALLCWDLDRLTRQPRQLEDWVDASEARGLVIVTANGEADLSTDGGRLFARIKAAVARAEIERKAARQRRAALQRAELGIVPGGIRLTGYASSGALIPAEAAVVAGMFERFHAGDSLRGIVAWLNETGVPTRNGGRWSPNSVRTILTNPRYAGRAVYQGEPNGREGRWEPVVEEWLFDMVASRLADPRRRSHVGTDRRYLGAGLYECWCGRKVRSHGAAGGGQMVRYRCPEGGHVTRLAPSIDAFVLAVLRERLARPDLAGLLAPLESAEAKRAAGEVRRLRARLERISDDYDAGLIDGHRYAAATEKTTVMLRAAEAQQARLLAPSAVASTLCAPSPVEAFDRSPLGVQRQVLRFFLRVVLLPAQRGRHFDADTVRITPAQGTGRG